MAGTHGTDQSPLITQRYLNTAAYVGDPAPGVVVATASVSGSIVQSYGGMLGGILTLGEGGANYYTDTVNGQQLYAGDYQYVQFYASSAAAAAIQGQIVFWLNNTTNLLSGNFIVTPDYALPQGPVAGIALGNTAKGNYWWIQVAGIAEVKFGAALTNITPSVGDLCFVTQAPLGPYADAYAGGTSITAGDLRLVLGRAFGTAPVESTISPIMLGIGPQYYPGG